MTTTQTATVEALTAEVRVLMVGSRQVTMSVYGQLDHVEHDEIEPFGRVMPKEAQAGIVYVIGKRAGAGHLVRSWLPIGETGIKRWVSERSSAAEYERSAENEDHRAAQCENEALGLEETAGNLLGEHYIPPNNLLGIQAGRRGANACDAAAEEHDREAERYEHEAALADDEITRLEALANAASEKYRAATDRKDAENARGQVASFQARARDCRTRKTVHESNAAAHRVMLGKWVDWEQKETEIVTARAAEWEALPLIVLAGLR